MGDVGPQYRAYPGRTPEEAMWAAETGAQQARDVGWIVADRHWDPSSPTPTLLVRYEPVMPDDVREQQASLEHQRGEHQLNNRGCGCLLAVGVVVLAIGAIGAIGAIDSAIEADNDTLERKVLQRDAREKAAPAKVYKDEPAVQHASQAQCDEWYIASIAALDLYLEETDPDMAAWYEQGFNDMVQNRYEGGCR